MPWGRVREVRLSANTDPLESNEPSSAKTGPANTLYREYLTMLLVLHAIGVAAIWATALRESPVTAAFFLSAAVWVCLLYTSDAADE